MARSDRKSAKPRSASAEPNRSIARRFAPGAMVVLLALIAMAPLCLHSFTNWDDDRTVAKNPSFNPASVDSVMQYWTEPYMDLYVPVTYMVWGVVAAVAQTDTGLDPRVFHTLNVIVHAGSAGMVFLILRRLLGAPRDWAAAIGAALFAVHPVQVETVGWISGLKDVLCGLLTLVALWAYVGGVQETGSASKKRTWFVLASIVFVLAMLSKPTAVVTPMLAAMIDAFVIRRPLKNVVRTLWPWALLAVPCVIWTKLAQPAEHVIAVAPAVWLRPLVALDALAFYLGKLVFPYPLTVDYGRRPDVAIARGWVYFTWLVPALVAGAIFLSRRRIPLMAAGGALAVAGLLPVLGLVRFDFQEFSTVADHYLYLPMLGVALAAAGVVANWPAKRCAIVAGAVLLVLTVRSWAQTTHWADSESLFSQVIAVNPGSSAGHNSLAAALLDRGAAGDAIPLARRAIDLNPADPRPRGTLAGALAATGKLAEAEAAYRDMLTIEPDNARALALLGGLLAQQGRLDEALPFARRAVSIDGNEPIARLNLGMMLVQRGELREAAEHLAIADRLAPDPRTQTLLRLISAKLNGTENRR